MVMTDPLADMFTRLRNAYKARHDMVVMPSSNVKVNIAKILKDKGFIKNYRVVEDTKQNILKMYLRYDTVGEPIMQGIKRISRPGLRRYTKAGEIPKVLNGLGYTILSTSKGVMAGEQAQEEGVGGEILCEIW